MSHQDRGYGAPGLNCFNVVPLGAGALGSVLALGFLAALAIPLLVVAVMLAPVILLIWGIIEATPLVIDWARRRRQEPEEPSRVS